MRTATKITGCLLLLGATATSAQNPPEEGPQIVFHYTGKDSQGRILVVPEASVTLGIVPPDGVHPAPLNVGDTMLCHVYTDGQLHYLLHCGSEHYGLLTLALTPKGK